MAETAGSKRGRSPATGGGAADDAATNDAQVAPALRRLRDLCTFDQWRATLADDLVAPGTFLTDCTKTPSDRSHLQATTGKARPNFDEIVKASKMKRVFRDASNVKHEIEGDVIWSSPYEDLSAWQHGDRSTVAVCAVCYPVKQFNDLAVCLHDVDNLLSSTLTADNAEALSLESEFFEVSERFWHAVVTNGFDAQLHELSGMHAAAVRKKEQDQRQLGRELQAGFAQADPSWGTTLAACLTKNAEQTARLEQRLEQAVQLLCGDITSLRAELKQDITNALNSKPPQPLAGGGAAAGRR